jgi:hypothetical protein
MSTTTPTIDLPRSKVRVIKPNKETGEIIERVIPAKSLRPRPPKHPGEIDFRRVDWVAREGGEGVTGRSVVYVLSHREAEQDYWEFFAHHLNRDEQRHLAKDDDSNSILRPFPPAWKPGDRMYIAKDMEAEVVEVTESVRGYGTVFKVHDHRVLYMKRGVIGGGGKPQVDEHGYPIVLTASEEEKARIESAYTGSASQSVDEGGGVMTDKEYQRIHSEQSASNAVRQRTGKVSKTKGGLRKRLAEAEAKNQRSTVIYLRRQLAALESAAA